MVYRRRYAYHKKNQPPQLSEIAERAKEKPIPLKKIVKEVHAYRKEKRNR